VATDVVTTPPEAAVVRSVARSKPTGPMTPMARHNRKWGLLFCSPAIVGLLVFTIYPVLMSLYYSFTSKTMVGGAGFVGWSNFRDLFTDSVFLDSLYNTAYIVVLSVPLGILVALGLALLLNLRVTGQSIYRVIFYLPAMVPIVASAVVWAYVFNPKYGVLNSLLGRAGIEGPGWLSDPAWAKPALIIMGVWGAGNLMVILLAGLQDVPQDLYDQAKVDGASTGSRFRHVTLPFLSPHLLFALVTGLIAGFQYFTPVYVLSGGTGGPAGSTMVSSLYLYQSAFTFFKMGYASAIAWVLFVITALAALITFRFVGRRVYYGGA
jgi:multiple sugar transport system permease protein